MPYGFFYYFIFIVKHKIKQKKSDTDFKRNEGEMIMSELNFLSELSL